MFNTGLVFSISLSQSFVVVGGLVLSYLVLRLSWLALCIFFSLRAHLFVNEQSLKNQTIELRSTFLHN